MSGSGWTVFAAVLVAVLAVVGGSYVVFQVYAPPASATAPVTPEVRQFGVYMQSFEAGGRKVHHWIPDVIAVNAGDTVILRVTNTDDENSHGFALGALNVSIPAIPSGETVTVRFVASRPGIYHYGCTLAGCAKDHADQIGQFVVLPVR